MSEKCEIIIANGLETRVWTHHPTYGYGCAECCNGDRCDEDCDAKYRRPNCPHCGGSGWIKKDDADTPPTTEEAELWRELMSTIGFEIKTDRDMAMVNGIIWDRMKTYSLSRRSEQKSEAIEFSKEKVTELVTLAYKEGFSRNGRPLGEWGDHYNENEAELKEYIDQLFKQKQREPKPATPGQWYARLESCKTPEDVDELEKRHADIVNANPDLRRLFVIYKLRLKKNLS